MKIYDSRTTKLIELKNDEITIYNCGPTVYNDTHIGNGRPLIIFDVLCKYLTAINKKVIYTHNITDVDDKIINEAKKNNISELEITKKYTNAYIDIINKLNAKIPNNMPLVTENIKGIIAYINSLVESKNAYLVNNEDVYFSIDTVKDIYGQISKQNFKEVLKDVRKKTEKNKHNPLDFVLWKKTSEGINWKSPWNETGRPGWHTECAYFISKFYGNKVNIHGGGIDLKFPHHENENAQHFAMYKQQMADIWMHIGHLNVNGQKMSKSLNNFILNIDLINQYGADVLRWFFLQTNYMHPINFSEQLIKNVKHDLEKMYKLINNTIIQLYLKNETRYKFNNIKPSVEFQSYMDNNLDYVNAITLVHKDIKKQNEFLKKNNFEIVIEGLNQIISHLQIFGLSYDGSFKNEIFKIIKSWRSSLIEKNYTQADIYRNQLIQAGIIL